VNLRTDDKRDRVLITVAGQIGSGKTEVCRELGRRTGWKIISAGGILRRMAAEHGMSILEFNEYAKAHKHVDQEIDGYLASLDNLPESLIIDSRLAWHFLPNSIKVYLIVERLTGAERVFLASRTDENHASAETARMDNAERQRLEQERFLSLYAVNAECWRNYDIVIDTSHASPAEVADVVMRHVAGGAGSARPECWLSPKRLVPTKSMSDIASSRAEDGFDEKTVIDIAVYKGAFLIVDGHVRASMALRLQRTLIRCRLVAFETEEVLGQSVNEFARTCTSMSVINAWEDAHKFRMPSHPPWLEIETFRTCP